MQFIRLLPEFEETPYRKSPGYLRDTTLENATNSPEISPPKSTLRDLERAITEVTSKKVALEFQREKGTELDKRDREFKIQEYEKKLLQYRALVAKAKEDQMN
ncbi:14659_t:CDS:2 [Entrophospora sp. SA101]|nr:14659_t:CDS:2 [Entrophospora sp. SA101]